MRIAGTMYNLNHKALEIYLSGCKTPHCRGCHNKELWDFDRGIGLGDLDRKLSIKLQNPMIEKVWILGGEPLDQDLKELGAFMALIHYWRVFKKTEYWIWTRYNNIPKEICGNFTHAKIGPYDKNLPSYINKTYGIELASTNQKIITLDK